MIVSLPVLLGIIAVCLVLCFLFKILKFVLVATVLILLASVSVILEVGQDVYQDISNYKTYEKFCDNRAGFCYCEFPDCEFKSSSSYQCVNGDCSKQVLSKDTIELCELASSLNDTETLFKAECEI